MEKLVDLNVSKNCGRIEMSSADVSMERGRKQFEKMVVDRVCNPGTVFSIPGLRNFQFRDPGIPGLEISRLSK